MKELAITGSSVEKMVQPRVEGKAARIRAANGSMGLGGVWQD